MYNFRIFSDSFVMCGLSQDCQVFRTFPAVFFLSPSQYIFFVANSRRHNFWLRPIPGDTTAAPRSLYAHPLFSHIFRVYFAQTALSCPVCLRPAKFFEHSQHFFCLSPSQYICWWLISGNTTAAPRSLYAHPLSWEALDLWPPEEECLSMLSHALTFLTILKTHITILSPIPRLEIK